MNNHDVLQIIKKSDLHSDIKDFFAKYVLTTLIDISEEIQNLYYLPLSLPNSQDTLHILNIEASGVGDYPEINDESGNNYVIFICPEEYDSSEIIDRTDYKNQTNNSLSVVIEFKNIANPEGKSDFYKRTLIMGNSLKSISKVQISYDPNTNTDTCILLGEHIFEKKIKTDIGMQSEVAEYKKFLMSQKAIFEEMKKDLQSKIDDEYIPLFQTIKDEAIKEIFINKFVNPYEATKHKLEAKAEDIFSIGNLDDINMIKDHKEEISDFITSYKKAKIEYEKVIPEALSEAVTKYHKKHGITASKTSETPTQNEAIVVSPIPATPNKNPNNEEIISSQQSTDSSDQKMQEEIIISSRSDEKIALQIAKSLGLADQSTNYNYIEDYKGRVVLGDNLVDFIAFGMNRQRVDGKDGDDFYVLDTEQLSTLPADSKMVISDDQGVHHFVILTEDESMRITIDPSWMGTSKKTIDIKGREVIVKDGDIASIVVATKEGKILQFSKKQGSTYIDGLKTSDNIVPVLIDKGDEKKIIEEKTKKLLSSSENKQAIQENPLQKNIKSNEDTTPLVEDIVVAEDSPHNKKANDFVNMQIFGVDKAENNKTQEEIVDYKAFLSRHGIVYKDLEKDFLKKHREKIIIDLFQFEDHKVTDTILSEVINPLEQKRDLLEKQSDSIFIERNNSLTHEDIEAHKKEVLDFISSYKEFTIEYEKKVLNAINEAVAEQKRLTLIAQERRISKEKITQQSLSQGDGEIIPVNNYQEGTTIMFSGSNEKIALQIAKSLGLADQSTNYNYIEDYKGRVVLGENLVDFIAFGMNRQRVDGKDGDDFYVLDTEQLSTLPSNSKMVIADDQGAHHFVILTEDESMSVRIDPSWMGTSKKTINIKGREIIIKEGDIASIVVATKEGKILQFSKKQGSTYIDGLKTSDNIVPVLIDKGDEKKIIEEKTSTPIETKPDETTKIIKSGPRVVVEGKKVLIFTNQDDPNIRLFNSANGELQLFFNDSSKAFYKFDRFKDKNDENNLELTYSEIEVINTAQNGKTIATYRPDPYDGFAFKNFVDLKKQKGTEFNEFEGKEHFENYVLGSPNKLNYFKGHKGNDTFVGNNHIDTFKSSDGNDIYIGGAGGDFYILDAEHTGLKSIRDEDSEVGAIRILNVKDTDQIKFMKPSENLNEPWDVVVNSRVIARLSKNTKWEIATFLKSDQNTERFEQFTLENGQWIVKEKKSKVVLDRQGETLYVHKKTKDGLVKITYPEGIPTLTYYEGNNIEVTHSIFDDTVTKIVETFDDKDVFTFKKIEDGRFIQTLQNLNDSYIDGPRSNNEVHGLDGNDIFTYKSGRYVYYGGKGSDIYNLSENLTSTIGYPIIIDDVGSSFDENSISFYTKSNRKLMIVEGGDKELNYFVYEDEPQKIAFAAAKHSVYGVIVYSQNNNELLQSFFYESDQKKLVKSDLFDDVSGKDNKQESLQKETEAKTDLRSDIINMNGRTHFIENKTLYIGKSHKNIVININQIGIHRLYQQMAEVDRQLTIHSDELGRVPLYEGLSSAIDRIVEVVDNKEYLAYQRVRNLFYYTDLSKILKSEENLSNGRLIGGQNLPYDLYNTDSYIKCTNLNDSYIDGPRSSNEVHGLDGNDIFTYKSGRDVYYGGKGSDIYNLSGNLTSTIGYPIIIDDIGPSFDENVIYFTSERKLMMVDGKDKSLNHFAFADETKRIAFASSLNGVHKVYIKDKSDNNKIVQSFSYDLNQKKLIEDKSIYSDGKDMDNKQGSLQKESGLKFADIMTTPSLRTTQISLSNEPQKNVVFGLAKAKF